MQNSAVTFLMYSFSFSVGKRLRNCLTANVLESALRRINRTDPPAPFPMNRPKNRMIRNLVFRVLRRFVDAR